MSSDDLTTPLCDDLCGKTTVEGLRRVWRGLHPPPQTVSRPIISADPLLPCSQSGDVSVYVYSRERFLIRGFGDCITGCVSNTVHRPYETPFTGNAFLKNFLMMFICKAHEKMSLVWFEPSTICVYV